MLKISMSGIIGCDVRPEDISRQLDEANGKDIDVHIASEGGFVFDGIAIYNSFRDYKRNYPSAQLMCTIKGLAASMASYLACNPAFDLVSAEDNAVFMIHNVQGVSVGDYRNMKKTSEIFESLSEMLGAAYAKRIGKKKAEIKELMDNTTWYFGDEIKKAGFVDEIVKTKQPENQNKAVALAQAQLRFMALSEKLSQSKIDVKKVAAMLPSTDISDLKQNNANPAALVDAGKNNNIMEAHMLDKFLSENPAAKVQFDAKLKIEKDAGIEEAKKQMQDIFMKASVFLKPDSTYPAPIKALAIDVLDGKKSVEALLTTVASFDALKESQNSLNAATESEKIGETPGQQIGTPTANGEIKNDVDFDAEVKRSKAMLGLEVK